MLPDFGWTELLVVAIVLIVVVGPKDLPKMLRTFGKTTASLRKMAGDFRKQFDDALKEAELEDVRNVSRDLRKLDPRNEIKEAFKPVSKAGQQVNEDLKKATADLDKPEKEKSAAEAALDSSGDKAREAKAGTAATKADKAEMTEQAPVQGAKPNGATASIETAGKEAAPAKKPVPKKKPAAKTAAAKSATTKPAASKSASASKSPATKTASAGRKKAASTSSRAKPAAKTTSTEDKS